MRKLIHASLLFTILLIASNAFAAPLRIDGATPRIAAGTTLQLRVFVVNEDGSDGRELTSDALTEYGSSDPSSATISETGLITAIAPGTVTITISNDEATDETPGSAAFELVVYDTGDLDGDRLPDTWETANGLDPTVTADAQADLDQDGLANDLEYEHGTKPSNPDTDGDGRLDGYEVRSGLDPKVAEVIKPARKMDSRCVVSILNRVARVRSNGTWILTNIPATGQQVRARATCQHVSPTFTEVGQSDFVIVPPNGQLQNVTITFDNPIPVPAKLTLTAPATKIDTLGDTLQLTSTISYSNNTTADATQFVEGTNYISSNPAIATVSEDGLVTAVSPGGVNISATNEGTLALLHLEVTGFRDADEDGMPDDWETANGFNPNDASDSDDDVDEDGLTNVAEFGQGSNPRTGDTDGDGVYDGLEVQLGTSPIDPSSVDMRRALTSIAIKPSSFTLTLTPMIRYVTRQLTVVGTMTDGKTVDLTAAARGTIYTSSDLTKVNFENANGKAASGDAGTVTITATNNGFTATASATVRSMPTALSSIAVGGKAMNVEIGGDFAYVAAGPAGLVVVDVANRKVPTIATTLPLPTGSFANDVRLGFGYAYVAAGATGLHIIDISNPRAPFIAGSFNTPGDARDVVLGPGGMAYVADGAGGVRILRIHVAAEPQELASFATTAEAQAVSVDGETLVVFSGQNANNVNTGRLDFVNVLNPAVPVPVGFFNAGSPAVDVEARDGYAFLAAKTSGMRIVDFRNPGSASLVETETSFYPSDVVLVDEWAFFAEELRVNSIPAVLVTNPASTFYAAPIDLSTLGDPNGLGIDADERYLYLAGDTGKLYIGQHYDATDEDGVKPTATIVSPAPGTPFVVGDPAPVRIEVADDFGVASVRTTVNGVFAPGLSRPPYAQYIKVPTNVTTIIIEVTVTDFGGNVGTTTQTFEVGPDPGTTVVGRVLLVDEVGAGGAIVTAFDKTATADANGNYRIENVSTVDGSIQVTAVYTEDGKTVDGLSARVTPVRSGTTNVPDILLRAGLVVRIIPTIPSGTTVTEWQPVEITVVAANDPGFYVEDVYLQLNGKTYAELRSWMLPYTTTIAVRGDANLATISARATDNAGNVALAPPIHYTLVADPGTRLNGVVKLADGTPVAGAQVSVREASLATTGIYVNYLGWSEAAYEELSTTTDANGAYSLPAVNTFRGDVIVNVAKIVGDDVQLAGKSEPITLERGQTIAVPQIVAATPTGVVGKLAVDTFISWTDLHQKRMGITNGGAVHFFDVADPTRPKLRGSLLLTDWWWANVVSFTPDGNRAVIVSDESRLFVLDVSDMNNPVFLGNIELGRDSATAAIIRDGLALIAMEDFVIVDISNPAAPVEVGRLPLPNDSSYLALSGNLVISTEWTTYSGAGVSSGISLIDISNPAAPTLVSRIPLTSGVGQPVIVGTRAYFADEHEVHMLDFSDPVNPVFTRDVMTFGTFETWSIAASGNRLFVGGEEPTATGRIAIGDITNPTAPVHSGDITDAHLTPYTSAWLTVNATHKFMSVLGWTRRDHPDLPDHVAGSVFIVRIPEETP